MADLLNNTNTYNWVDSQKDDPKKLYQKWLDMIPPPGEGENGADARNPNSGIYIEEQKQQPQELFKTWLNSTKPQQSEQVDVPLSSPEEKISESTKTSTENEMNIPNKTEYKPYSTASSEDTTNYRQKLQDVMKVNPLDDRELTQALEDRKNAIKNAALGTGIQNALVGMLGMSAKQKVETPKDLSPDLFGAQNYQNLIDAKKTQMLNQQMLNQKLANVGAAARTEDEIRSIENKDRPLDDISKVLLKQQIGLMRNVPEESKTKAYDLIESGQMTPRMIEKSPLMQLAMNNVNATWVKTEIIGNDGKIKQVMVNNKDPSQMIDIGPKGLPVHYAKNEKGEMVAYDRGQTVNPPTSPAGTANYLADPKTIAFIQKQEGFTQYPKKDTDGNFIVGYGTKISPEQADAIIAQGGVDRVGAQKMLQEAMSTNAKPYIDQIEKPLNQNQAAALTSAFYNLGSDSRQAIVDKINSGASDKEIGAYLQQFSNARQPDGSKVPMEGLVNRRNAEAQLYYTPNNVVINGLNTPVPGKEKGQPIKNEDYLKLNAAQRKVVDDMQHQFTTKYGEDYVKGLQAANIINEHIDTVLKQKQQGLPINADLLQSIAVQLPSLEGLKGHVTDSSYAQFKGDQSLQNQIGRIVNKWKDGAPMTDKDLGNVLELTKNVRHQVENTAKNMQKLYLGPLQQKIPGADASLLTGGVDYGMLAHAESPTYDRATNKLSPIEASNNIKASGSGNRGFNAIPFDNASQLPE